MNIKNIFIIINDLLFIRVCYFNKTIDDSFSGFNNSFAIASLFSLGQVFSKRLYELDLLLFVD